MTMTMRRRTQGGTTAADGTVPNDGRESAVEGAATLKGGAEKSPSLQDGYNGAGDASRLERYALLLTTEEDLERGLVTVQCTPWTREMLHRSGLRRCRTFDSYQVRVIRARFNRLQLAAAKEVAA